MAKHQELSERYYLINLVLVPSLIIDTKLGTDYVLLPPHILLQNCLQLYLVIFGLYSSESNQMDFSLSESHRYRARHKWKRHLPLIQSGLFTYALH